MHYPEVYGPWWDSSYDEKDLFSFVLQCPSWHPLHLYTTRIESVLFGRRQLLRHLKEALGDLLNLL